MTNIYEVIMISILVAISCVIINVPIAIITSYIFARKKFFSQSILETILCLPLVMPPVVTGYILLIIFSKNAIIGKSLLFFGISVPFSFLAAVIASAVVSFPLVFKTIKLSIEQIDVKYEMNSYILGKNFIQTFFQIIIPMSKKGILSAMLLAFARSLGEFGATIMFAGNIPGKTQTISIAIYSAFNMVNGDNTIKTLVIISIVISFIATFIANKIQNKEKK